MDEVCSARRVRVSEAPVDVPVPAGRPNVVLIVLDSVRAANVSTYGYHRPTAPALDRLAAEGTTFEQATSVGCWTLPVHTTLFTGRYPAAHGVTVSAQALGHTVPTLAETLHGLGYETACFSNNAYISEASGLTRGFDHVDDLWRVTNPRGVSVPKLTQRIRALERRGPMLRPLVGVLRRAKRARMMFKAWRSRKDSGARYTNDRIRSWLRGRDTDRPFFMFVNYMESHEPYLPPYPYNRRFIPARYSPWRVLRSAGRRDDILASDPRRRQEDLEILEGLYDGTIRYADEMVGRVVEILDAETGGPANTAVIVTSDHGDAFGEHGHLGHRLTLYEELLRVPLVARLPGRFDKGRRVAAPVSLGDLHPTILAMAGSASVGDNDFASLLDDVGADRPVIAENTGPKSIDGLEMRSRREGSLKLIWRGDGRHELYDLATDPQERTNIFASDPRARGLLERTEAWWAAMTADAAEVGSASYDDETMERLRGLGYVG
jgi:arylsulfatase A-like enzyme